MSTIVSRAVSEPVSDPTTDLTPEPDQVTPQAQARMCFVCGVGNDNGLQMKFFSTGESSCRAEVTLDAQFQGYPGIAHGGIVAAILDEALGRAPFSGDPNRFMFTGKLEVRYRKTTPLHTPLIVNARIDKDRGRMVTTRAEIILPDGSVCAEGEATLLAVPAEMLNQIDAKAVGWQIYP